MPIIPLTRSGPENGGNFEYPWTGPYLQVHLLSDVGEKRSKNEDCCLVCIPENRNLLDDRGILVAVADGMGGVSGGAFASRLALETAVDYYYSAQTRLIPARMREAVQQANQRIFEEAANHPEYYGMGTTVSAVVVKGDHAYVAQVGDSRVYVARNDRTVWQVTEDHSWVAEQVRDGLISEQDARSHPFKNRITRAVGTKEDIKVDLFVVQLREGDTILICSDGLSNVRTEREIGDALALDGLQGTARVLVGRALEAGGPDNITVALVRVTLQPPKTKADHGAVKVALAKRGFFGRLKSLFS